MDRLKAFLVQSPPLQRFLAGAVMGGVVLLAMGLLTVYPSVKTLREATAAGREQAKLLDGLKAEETQVRKLVEEIQSRLNAGKLADSPKARSNEDVARFYENLEAAVNTSGVTLTGPLDVPARQTDRPEGRVKEYQPVNLQFSGNYQNVIWLFQEAARLNALPQVMSLKLGLEQKNYPNMSGSVALRLLVADYAANAPPPGVTPPADPAAAGAPPQ